MSDKQERVSAEISNRQHLRHNSPFLKRLKSDVGPIPVTIMVACLLLMIISVGCGGGGTAVVTPTPTPTPAITVAISPTAVNTMSGTLTGFSATVSGTSNTQVTWSVVEGSTGGSISSTGMYTSPGINGVFHVQATSVVDIHALATATVTVGTPLPPSQTMWSVWGSGQNDVWAVGDSVVYHWNGSQWHSALMPSRYGPYADHIYAVWGSGANNVWQAGSSLALEFKRWDGSTWTDFPPNDVVFVFGLWGSGPNDIWGLGATGSSIVFHFDGKAWTYLGGVPITAGQSYWLQAAWGSSATDVWAIGGGDDTGKTLRSATVFHWDGFSWKQYLSGLNHVLIGIWGAGANDIWTVGEGGLIAHWDGSAWTPVASGTTQNLWGVWGSSSTDVWAVGAGGTVLHWNGVAWSPVPTSTTNDLRAVWGSGPTDVWVVGDRTIMHLP